MAFLQQQGNKPLTKGFYEQLFDTGIFSDVTIKYGQNHTFKAHSVVLTAKSRWFAQKCGLGPTVVRLEDFPPPSDLKLFQRVAFKPCGTHCEHGSDKCRMWRLFLRMLLFCYTGSGWKVELPENTQAEPIYHNAVSNIYMYYLGYHYGVEDILPLAIQGFIGTTKRLHDENKDHAISAVNLVYDLFGFQKDDGLVIEARKLAERIVPGLSVEMYEAAFLDAMKNQIKAKMPKAGIDLIDRGYTPQVPLLKRDDNSCFRCRKAPTIREFRICRNCVNIPIFGQDIVHTGNASVVKFWDKASGTAELVRKGITCTFWGCGGCGKTWQGQGLRQSNVELGTCPACRMNEESPRNTSKEPEIVQWRCKGCLTRWGAWAVHERKMGDMDKCVCCPEDKDE